jgi:hypothetical protein
MTTKVNPNTLDQPCRVMSRVSFSVRIAARFLLAAVLFQAPYAIGLPRSAGSAEIHGRATECWEGRHRPVADLRVYVLTLEESERVRAVLNKMKQLPHGDSPESAQHYVQEFNKLYDELIAETKALGEPKGLTRTDKDGKYAGKNLQAGKRYLVLAIDWERDDSEAIGYFDYSLTDSLRTGVTTLNVYMGPGMTSDCRDN